MPGLWRRPLRRPDRPCEAVVLAAPRAESGGRELARMNPTHAMAALRSQRSVLLAERLIALYQEYGHRSLRGAASSMRGSGIDEFGVSGSVHDQLRRSPGFSFSEFFDGVEPGSLGPGGVRCEDIEDLTFDDETIDLVISQDVFEHVSDPDAGFRETQRVLRPGGRHVFTVPYDPALPVSLTRARRATDGSIEHVLPPVYHHDLHPPHGERSCSPTMAPICRIACVRRVSRPDCSERRRANLPGGYSVSIFETTRPGRVGPGSCATRALSDSPPPGPRSSCTP